MATTLKSVTSSSGKQTTTTSTDKNGNTHTGHGTNSGAKK